MLNVASNSNSKISLEDLPAGSLFKFETTIGFKSEYTTDDGAIEAYIVGSGEFFWGGTAKSTEQRKLLVTQLNLIQEDKQMPKKFVELQLRDEFLELLEQLQLTAICKKKANDVQLPSSKSDGTVSFANGLEIQMDDEGGTADKAVFVVNQWNEDHSQYTQLAEFTYVSEVVQYVESLLLKHFRDGKGSNEDM